MPAVPLTRPAAEDAEGAPPEPLADGVYLRPCNPIPGAALTFDLVDVLFRGMPARRQVRLQHAVLPRWTEKNAPGTADEIAALSARLSAPRGPVCGLALDRPRLMGVLNVTPDSFSDGGDFADEDDAAAHGHAMADSRRRHHRCRRRIDPARLAGAERGGGDAPGGSRDSCAGR